jgi:hypothetical protein
MASRQPHTQGGGQAGGQQQQRQREARGRVSERTRACGTLLLVRLRTLQWHMQGLPAAGEGDGQQRPQCRSLRLSFAFTLCSMSSFRLSRRREQVAQLNPESLPAIRLLMREMEVAVSDEDYEQAARLRDHPWMRLAEDINMHWCA